ncbi:hypothetical protein [Desulforamulus ruminis]|uniref:Uncharacterized protein n=1 Tax=Desulforamulus ruminis (strain ATCC 23193 / DSM 2154 / NCIMB 8452 / DL) TaxID=696281 RepID=F6DSJ6_DESRL|nr:hypothetical protein [Desulforamulus ruminis]AEG61086.1 hypothetical protein Desru_2872 [Desulforamulus ruminis DSM 2154]
MTIVERLFQIKSQDPKPYCPRAFLQKVYNLGYRNQGMMIVELKGRGTGSVCYYAEIKKRKVLLIEKSKEGTTTEIVGSLENLMAELTTINLNF